MILPRAKPNSGKATYLPTYPHQPTSEIWEKKEKKATLVLTSDFFCGENLPSIYEVR